MTAPDAARAPRFLRLVQVWVWIGAFYYVQVLLTADFSSSFEESSAHKFFKYGVCLAIGTIAAVKARRILPLGLAYFFLMVAVVDYLALGRVTVFGTVAATIGAMIGLVSLGDVRRAEEGVALAIVTSAAAVGAIAVFEVFVLGDHMAAIWRATNSVRAISTLLNPNNLAMYMGCALILLFGVAADRDRRWRILLAVPIVAGLLLSGSRTAWVAMLAVVVLDTVRRGRIWSRVMQLGPRTVAGGLLLAVVAALGSAWFSAEDYGVEEAYRGFDPYTAQLRLELMFAYLREIDASLLLPDYADTRAHLVQDSVYTMTANAFGIGALFLALAVLAVVMVRREEHSAYRYLWWLVLVFYLVSGLGGSFLTSFPNNQAFFIAVGMLFTDRLRRRASVEAPVAAHG